MDEKAKNAVGQFPDSPGVYIFRDASGRIIYIGKAASLKKRAQSYFSRGLSSKTRAMVSRISSVQYKATPSESQAEILEAELIKRHRPQYNTSLKDDKSFPYIQITKEDFPRIIVSRRRKKGNDDPDIYLGPYTDALHLRQAVKAIRRIFGFRSCKKMPSRRCLYGRLGLCPAPCVGNISKDSYAQIIANVILLLEGKTENLIGELLRQMRQSSGQMRYEEAARLRDQVNALTAVTREGRGGLLADGLEGLKRLAGMGRSPDRIEGFDISDIGGQEACGAMVSFYKGRPDKDNYRRFRIKAVKGIDDYGMLAEVVSRRYSRRIKEGLPLPDMILIDGGSGHLAVARKELKGLGLDIALVGIAKEQENIYVGSRRKPVRLSSESPVLNLIRRIRDEAHRFAQSYHHVLRRKKIIGR